MWRGLLGRALLGKKGVIGGGNWGRIFFYNLFTGREKKGAGAISLLLNLDRIARFKID